MKPTLFRWTRWWEDRYLGLYKKENLAVRTQLRILLLLLTLNAVVLVILGPPQFVLAPSESVRWGIASMYLLIPLLFFFLRRGRRHLVVRCYILLLALLLAGPQVLDAFTGYDALKLDRIAVLGLLQLIGVASITEKPRELAITYLLFLGALGAEAFWVLPSHPEAVPSEIFRVTSRLFFYLTIAWIILHFLQKGFHRAIRSVEHANKVLETRVRRRTEELNRAQELLRKSEKLILRGRTAALVAHEINTPLGAIQSSSDNLSNAVRQAVEWAVRQKTGSGAEEDRLLVALWMSLRSGNAGEQGSRRRALRTSLGKQLGRWQVSEPEYWADRLLDAGLLHLDSEWAPLFSGPETLEAVEALTEAALALKAAGRIGKAVEKAAQFVSALQETSQGDTSGKAIPVNVAADLRVVLRLFGDRTTQALEAFPSRENQGLVLADPGRLMLLWNCLVVEALGPSGKEPAIRITLVTEGGDLLVRFRFPARDAKEPDEEPGSFGPTEMNLALSVVRELGGGLQVCSEGTMTGWDVRLPLWDQKPS